MTQRTDSVDTPRYVLMSGNQPIYPTINFDDPDTHCVCVYGFSDRSIYDTFIEKAAQALTPYPLVKRYLSKQIAALDAAGMRDGCLKLVILDATDPAQPALAVATMETVLLAHQDNTNQVPVEYEFVFDPETSGYRFRDGSRKVPAINPLSFVK